MAWAVWLCGTSAEQCLAILAILSQRNQQCTEFINNGIRKISSRFWFQMKFLEPFFIRHILYCNAEWKIECIYMEICQPNFGGGLEKWEIELSVWSHFWSLLLFPVRSLVWWKFIFVFWWTLSDAFRAFVRFFFVGVVWGQHGDICVFWSFWASDSSSFVCLFIYSNLIFVFRFLMSLAVSKNWANLRTNPSQNRFSSTQCGMESPEACVSQKTQLSQNNANSMQTKPKMLKEMDEEGFSRVIDITNTSTYTVRTHTLTHCLYKCGVQWKWRNEGRQR